MQEKFNFLTEYQKFIPVLIELKIVLENVNLIFFDNWIVPKNPKNLNFCDFFGP